MTPEDPDETVDHIPAARGAAVDHPAAVVGGYELMGKLGHGGMGVVYKARQRSLNRIVALKLILERRYSPEAVNRFRFEAEALARVNHPNIVQIYEIGEHHRRHYFAMEFVEGGTLRDVVRSNLREGHSVAQIVELLARAVHAAHAKGIVHGDLKPSNVLRTPDGTMKIADFGLAKQRDDPAWQGNLTCVATIRGTPAYMAPEQVRGQVEDIAPPTDVYALGVILYELLTSRTPFKGPNLGDTLLEIVLKDPPPPSHWEPGVPPRLDTICLKCLCKDPNQRYSTALALADELKSFVARAWNEGRKWWHFWKRS